MPEWLLESVYSTIAQAPIPELSLEELMHQFLGVSFKILEGQGHPRPEVEKLQEIWFSAGFSGCFLLKPCGSKLLQEATEAEPAQWLGCDLFRDLELEVSRQLIHEGHFS